MKQTYNKKDFLKTNEHFDNFFDEESDELGEESDEFNENLEDLNDQNPLFEHETKQLHRYNRKKNRRAKRQQLKLASSVNSKHKSPYRWNPLFHAKHAHTSPKKLKNRFDSAFGKNALKDFFSC